MIKLNINSSGFWIGVMYQYSIIFNKNPFLASTIDFSIKPIVTEEDIILIFVFECVFFH